jgi:Flp pilus assembly protein TadG
MPKIIRSTKAQAMVEAALAVPILILLLAGCVQLIQIAIGHIVVLEAAYEANRQVIMDQGKTDNAVRVAKEICSAISPGATDYDLNTATVTHHLRSIFPIIKKVDISHSCSPYIFGTDVTVDTAP